MEVLLHKQSVTNCKMNHHRSPTTCTLRALTTTARLLPKFYHIQHKYDRQCTLLGSL